MKVEIGRCLICSSEINEFSEVCNACYLLISAKRDELAGLRESEVWNEAVARPLIQFFDQFEARRAARWAQKV
jgi:hypothetical protein